MDFSPPPFHSSSSWYVLRAFHIGSFWQGERQGRPGDSLSVEGRGPPLQSSLQAPFSAATAKWGRFLFGVGVGGYFYHWGTTICSQFLLPVAVSLDWLK